MRLLLDTHILLWALDQDSRLSVAVRRAIESADNDVFVSIASVWEIAIKHAAGRLDAPVDQLPEVLREMRAEPLPMTVHHALAAARLPRHHDDPFDRMLIAQARLDGLILITHDKAIRRYDVPLFDNIAPGP